MARIRQILTAPIRSSVPKMYTENGDWLVFQSAARLTRDAASSTARCLRAELMQRALQLAVSELLRTDKIVFCRLSSRSKLFMLSHYSDAQLCESSHI